MDKFNELQTLLDGMKTDLLKSYEKGNKAAGVRVRKTLKEISNLIKEIRVETLKEENY